MRDRQSRDHGKGEEERRKGRKGRETEGWREGERREKKGGYGHIKEVAEFLVKE